MSTISAILEADADGTLHLPLPAPLRHGKIKVEARLERVRGTGPEEEARQRELTEILGRIRTRNPFQGIVDPVAWQRDIRQDRALPGRD